MGHHEISEKVIEEILIENPSLASEVYGVLGELQSFNSRFPKWFVDSIVQTWEGRPATKADAYVLLIINALKCDKKLFWCTTKIGQEPFPDNDKVNNNKALQLLPPPFSGAFYGGKGDGDGYLKWDKPISLESNCYDCGFHIYKEISPNTAPLEVGYTKALTTLNHLNMSGFLARWPYEHDKLYLFHLESSEVGIHW